MELDFRFASGSVQLVRQVPFVGVSLLCPFPLCRLLFPEDFLKGLLAEGKREDGRKPTQFRTASVNTGSISSSDGSAVVRIGGTCVVCGVRAELANPPSDRPGEGYIVCSVDLPHSSSRPHQNQSAQSIAQTVQEILLSSRFLELKELVIKEGELCWCLYVDLVCISEDGAVLDSALLAAVAALRDVKLPAVEVSDSSQTPEVDPSQSTPLSMGPVPTVTSFGLHHNWPALLDPSSSEQNLCSGELAVAMTDSGQLCGIYKNGGSAMKADDLTTCIQSARRRGEVLQKLLQAAAPSKT